MHSGRLTDPGQDVVVVAVRGVREALRVAPGVLEAQAGAVVDGPQVAVPDEQVGVPRAAIDVGDVGVEPDDPRRQIRGWLLDDRIEHHR